MGWNGPHVVSIRGCKKIFAVDSATFLVCKISKSLRAILFWKDIIDHWKSQGVSTDRHVSHWFDSTVELLANSKVQLNCLAHKSIGNPTISMPHVVKLVKTEIIYLESNLRHSGIPCIWRMDRHIDGATDERMNDTN